MTHTTKTAIFRETEVNRPLLCIHLDKISGKVRLLSRSYLVTIKSTTTIAIAIAIAIASIHLDLGLDYVNVRSNAYKDNMYQLTHQPDTDPIRGYVLDIYLYLSSSLSLCV